MSDVAEKVKAIVVEHLGVEADKVTDTASFIDDLGADSLDNVELVMAFEEEFGVEIPDDATNVTITVTAGAGGARAGRTGDRRPEQHATHRARRLLRAATAGFLRRRRLRARAELPAGRRRAGPHGRGLGGAPEAGGPVLSRRAAVVPREVCGHDAGALRRGVGGAPGRAPRSRGV